MSPLRGILTVVGVLAMMILGPWVTFSALEARAYNNSTGKNVTTLDAMFISFSVQVIDIKINGASVIEKEMAPRAEKL